MKVLVVDGPVRGCVHDTKDLRFTMVQLSPLSLTFDDVKQTVYYVHRFYVAGQMINLASTSITMDGIKDRDVFELIISDIAKEAVA